MCDSFLNYGPKQHSHVKMFQQFDTPSPVYLAVFSQLLNDSRAVPMNPPTEERASERARETETETERGQTERAELNTSTFVSKELDRQKGKHTTLFPATRRRLRERRFPWLFTVLHPARSCYVCIRIYRLPGVAGSRTDRRPALLNNP